MSDFVNTTESGLVSSRPLNGGAGLSILIPVSPQFYKQETPDRPKLGLTSSVKDGKVQIHLSLLGTPKSTPLPPWKETWAAFGSRWIPCPYHELLVDELFRAVDRGTFTGEVGLAELRTIVSEMGKCQLCGKRGT